MRNRVSCMHLHFFFVKYSLVFLTLSKLGQRQVYSSFFLKRTKPQSGSLCVACTFIIACLCGRPSEYLQKLCVIEYKLNSVYVYVCLCFQQVLFFFSGNKNYLQL